MKKSKKTLLIVILSLLFACGLTYVILYAIFPSNTQKYTWLVFDYICNKPLPVIGISTLLLAFIVYKLVKFIVKAKNKKEKLLELKIEDLTKKLNSVEEERKQMEDELKQFIQHTCEGFARVSGEIREVCETIPNKKVNALGDKFYGSKEETN